MGVQPLLHIAEPGASVWLLFLTETQAQSCVKMQVAYPDHERAGQHMRAETVSLCSSRGQLEIYIAEEGPVPMGPHAVYDDNNCALRRMHWTLP